VALELDPEKWKPVFGKDHAQTKNLDPDPIQLNQGLAAALFAAFGNEGL
jgi:hypothetical protein